MSRECRWRKKSQGDKVMVRSLPSRNKMCSQGNSKNSLRGTNRCSKCSRSLPCRNSPASNTRICNRCSKEEENLRLNSNTTSNAWQTCRVLETLLLVSPRQELSAFLLQMESPGFSDWKEQRKRWTCESKFCFNFQGKSH